MKYKDWLDVWLKNYIKPTAKRRTYERYSQVVEQHIIDKLGDEELDDIHGELPVTYVQEMAFQDNPYIERVILPDSVKSLNGSVFAGCSKLTFVSMTGVENLQYHGSSLGYVDGRGNNFINCTALKYVVLNPNFSTDAQQFFAGTAPTQPILDIYVNAASGTPNFGGANTNLLTGTIYYKGDASKCGYYWSSNDNDEIVTSEYTNHEWDKNGKCSHGTCGAYNTAGISYTYDSTLKTYYVSGCAKNVQEAIVLPAYNDGTNGEKAVTYVANNVFIGLNITKLILPESVTTLKGGIALNCYELQYVSMIGVTELNDWGANNNFLNCAKLETVIVNKALQVEAQQFKYADSSVTKVGAKMYVFGAEKDSTIKIEYTHTDLGAINDLLSADQIYYYSETQKSGCWHYDENGNVAIWA